MVHKYNTEVYKLLLNMIGGVELNEGEEGGETLFII